MPSQEYGIEIRADSVDVGWDNSHRSIQARAVGSFAYMAAGVVVFCLIMFTKRHGASTWWELTTSPRDSARLVMANAIVAIASGLLGLFVLIGMRNFFLSGEKLHCDRSQMTLSRIPWYSFTGRWTARSFSLAEISKMEYGVVYSGKGGDTYGISFSAHGWRKKLFAGIDARDAFRILRGMESLGVDVRYDPEMLAQSQAMVQDRTV
jgi:hypothetical protein